MSSAVTLCVGTFALAKVGFVRDKALRELLEEKDDLFALALEVMFLSRLDCDNRWLGNVVLLEVPAAKEFL